MHNIQEMDLLYNIVVDLCKEIHQHCLQHMEMTKLDILAKRCILFLQPQPNKNYHKKKYSMAVKLKE
jgi:hypothetical protein